MPRGVYDRGKPAQSTARDPNPVAAPGRVDVQPRCERCRWFEADRPGAGAGECRRYPEPMRCYEDHWCGEFRIRTAEAIS